MELIQQNTLMLNCEGASNTLGGDLQGAFVHTSLTIH